MLKVAVIVALVLLALLVAFVVYFRLFIAPKINRANNQRLLKLMTRGVERVAYVVYANPVLYEKGPSGDHSYAQVVYTTDPDDPQLRTDLVAIADRFRKFQREDMTDETERLLESVLSTQTPLLQSLRLPPRVAGGRTAFTASITVLWDHFVQGKLASQYVQVRAMADELDEIVLLVPEPGSPLEGRHRATLDEAKREAGESN